MRRYSNSAWHIESLSRTRVVDVSLWYSCVIRLIESVLDDLHEAKEALADANRKLHELDLENARLAGEIRELQTAVKEAEAARRDAENRAQRAIAELQQLRAEMERRLQEKEEEMEAMR